MILGSQHLKSVCYKKETCHSLRMNTFPKTNFEHSLQFPQYEGPFYLSVNTTGVGKLIHYVSHHSLELGLGLSNCRDKLHTSKL